MNTSDSNERELIDRLIRDVTDVSSVESQRSAASFGYPPSSDICCSSDELTRENTAQTVASNWNGDPTSRQWILKRITNCLAGEPGSAEIQLACLIMRNLGDGWQNDHELKDLVFEWLKSPALANDLESALWPIHRLWKADAKVKIILCEIVRGSPLQDRAESPLSSKAFAARILADAYPGDPTVKSVLIETLETTWSVDLCNIITEVLISNWPGDAQVAKIFCELLSPQATRKQLFCREDAMQGLGQGWRQLTIIRDAIVNLLNEKPDACCEQDDEEVRIASIRALARVWTNDSTVKEHLIATLCHADIRGNFLEKCDAAWEAALDALATHWHEDLGVRDFLCSFLAGEMPISLSKKSQRYVDELIPQALIKGWPKDQKVQDCLIKLAGSQTTSSRGAALRALSGELDNYQIVRQLCLKNLFELQHNQNEATSDTHMQCAAIASLLQINAQDPQVKAILLAAISKAPSEQGVVTLTDSARATAITECSRAWSNDPALRDVLLDLLTLRANCGALKEESAFVRTHAAISLGTWWRNSPEVKEHLWHHVLSKIDRSFVEGDAYTRKALVSCFFEGWERDSSLRDFLCSLLDARTPEGLIAEPSHFLREVLPGAIARAWPGDPQARDSILRFLSDQTSRDRETEREVVEAVKALERGWPADVVTEKGLLKLWSKGDPSPSVLSVARLALERTWGVSP